MEKIKLNNIFNLSKEEINKREQYWKKCLNTIEHGYNDN
jgi:hypothetical protein